MHQEQSSSSTAVQETYVFMLHTYIVLTYIVLQYKKKNNGKKELDIENANRLEVLLDDIDRMEVLQLIQ